jgi:hypothetical protein
VHEVSETTPCCYSNAVRHSVRPTHAPRLKAIAIDAEIAGTMTVSTLTTIDELAAHPFGKAARIAMAVLGTASAVLVLMVATIYTEAAWPLVLLGAALAATSARAASKPSLIRLSSLGAVMVAILYVGRTL